MVDLVPAQLISERAELGVGSDAHEFDACDGGKVFEVLAGDRIAEARVMGSPSMDPGCTSSFEIWAAFPDGAGDWQLRQRLRWGDGIDFVNEQSEPVPEVDERCVERRPSRAIEDEANGIFFAADAERMNFASRFG